MSRAPSTRSSNNVRLPLVFAMLYVLTNQNPSVVFTEGFGMGVDLKGLEPLTSSMPLKRSPN